MNRKERRKLEKKNVIEKFDPDVQHRMKFSIEIPPGLLRDDGKSSRSGAFTADNEVDLTRGMFVKLLESFGFINQQQAVIGLFASVVNPFPKTMRGALAYAIINGTGLQIVEDQVEVCWDCEAEKLMTLNMEAEQPADDDEGKCQVREGDGLCGATAADDIHGTTRPTDLFHDFVDVGPPMKDTTKHAENCEARVLVEGEHREVAVAEWKEITAVIVLTPVMYEPLQPKADEDVEVVEEAAGEEAEPVDNEADHYPMQEPDAPVNIDTARADSKDALIDDGE